MSISFFSQRTWDLSLARIYRQQEILWQAYPQKTWQLVGALAHAIGLFQHILHPTKFQLKLYFLYKKNLILSYTTKIYCFEH